MSFIKYFWMGYYIASNPNKTYQRGWQDAINGSPRHQYRMAFIFEHFKETQRLYDKGYNDGLQERLINKF